MTAKRILRVLLVLGWTASCVTAAPLHTGNRAAVEPADLAILNASVMTIDPTRPRAEAIAVTGEWIVQVGSNADIAYVIRNHKARVGGDTVDPPARLDRAPGDELAFEVEPAPGLPPRSPPRRILRLL